MYYFDFDAGTTLTASTDYILAAEANANDCGYVGNLLYFYFQSTGSIFIYRGNDDSLAGLDSSAEYDFEAYSIE